MLGADGAGTLQSCASKESSNRMRESTHKGLRGFVGDKTE